MDKIFINQVGFRRRDSKKAILNFEANGFELIDRKGMVVYKGEVVHYGEDDISGENTYIADFSEYTEPGSFKVRASMITSYEFEISDKVYDQLLRDVCKAFYYLRCGNTQKKEFSGKYYHAPCHLNKAMVYGSKEEMIDVSGGWHDAGDYGRYSTAGAVACAHILYGIRMFGMLEDTEFDIPKINCEKGEFPDILSEVKTELDFLLKMQRKDGGVWHKVTTFCHAPFIMPENDLDQLYLFAVSSMATADAAAVFALAYTVYRRYDEAYAKTLLEASEKSYMWLERNEEAVLFKNPEGSNTGEYGESEDLTNRFWASVSLYEAKGDDKYFKDAEKIAKKIRDNNIEFTGFGWASVAGFGFVSLLFGNNDCRLYEELKNDFLKEAKKLSRIASENGFDLCMERKDFVWGSNMEVLKNLMILIVADYINKNNDFGELLNSGLDYLLGCNSMDVSYVTGHGENAFKNPHLRPVMAGNIESWPGLVSGGPNITFMDDKARELPKELAPMKCYMDHKLCYSLNEITIYWNSPLVFVLAGMAYDYEKNRV
ncbi:MAG: glycoside hydrolase family 9 protein [Lachnospiraceae bacterium]|nr:glycoside hydrolase family 9 protein [Lachnospiraceae bacterium]